MLPELRGRAETVRSVRLTISGDSMRSSLAEYAAKFYLKHAGEADAHGMAQDHLYPAFKC